MDSYWRGLNSGIIRPAFEKENFGHRVMDMLGWGLGGGILRTGMVIVGMWKVADRGGI